MGSDKDEGAKPRRPSQGIDRRTRAAGAVYPVLIATALAAAALFFVLILISLVSLNGIVASVRSGHGVVLHAWDLVLGGAAAALFAGMCALEVRFGGVRRVLSGESPVALTILTGAIVLWFVHALLTPGLVVTGDAGTHVARVNHLAMALRGGDSLYWDNSFFAGSTALQFTGPDFHWLATLVCLVVGDATVAVKCVVIAGRCFSACVCWLYLRRIGLARTAAAFGALFYAGAFFQTAIVESVRSNFPQIVNLVCLPATLFFIERVLRERKVVTPSWIGLCLTVTAFIGNHQPTAVMAAVFVVPYAIVRLVMLEADYRRLAALAWAGAAASVCSVYFVLPFLAERGLTAEAFSQAVIHLHVPGSREITDFLVWGAVGSGSDSSSYLGLSVLACAAAGCFFCLRNRCRERWTCGLFAIFVSMALLSVLLGGSYVRQALFTTFFVSVAAAIGVQVLLTAFSGFRALPVIILAAFLADVGPLAVQPWVRPDMRSLERAGDALARQAAASRVIETEHDKSGLFFVSVGPDSTPLNYARVQVLNGPHKMEATKGHNAMAAVLQDVQDDLNKGLLSADTAGLLGIYNVGWIVGHQKARMGLPDSVAGTEADDAIGAHLRVPDATPFLVSGRLVRKPMPTEFGGPPFWQNDFLARTRRALEAKADARRAFDAMDVDLVHRQAGQFLVQNMPGWAQESGEAPSARLVDYRVWPGQVRLVVNADRAGFLRLSHPFYPTLHVTENGVAVQAEPDVFSMMVVTLPKGRTDIEVVAQPSLLRVGCFWISAGCVGGLMVMLMAMYVRGQRVFRSARD